MFEDVMTYPEHIIKELKARVRELEEECKNLRDQVEFAQWRADYEQERRENGW